MLLQDILKAKGIAIFWIAPQATLADAVHELVTHHISGAVVGGQAGPGRRPAAGGHPFRARSALRPRRPARPPRPGGGPGQCPWMDCKVAELMTSELIIASPADSVEQVMGLMTTKRIRHLPVLSDDRAVGIVSIGDIVKAQHDSLGGKPLYEGLHRPAAVSFPSPSGRGSG